MNKKYTLFNRQGLFLVLLVLMTSSMIIGIPTYNGARAAADTNGGLPDNLTMDQLNKLLQSNKIGGGSQFASEGQSLISQDVDLSKLLRNNPNDYHQTYQPWKSKAAVRCLTVTDDYQYLAVGGGYLYDNEIQVYRWNDESHQYAKVWVSGDEIIKSDVIDIAFGDTDHNNLLEIVAASADGHFYVFEQQHIYDPITNTENMFVPVYTSPYLGQVWGITVYDADLDSNPDIIAVSWDYKVHVFEYTDHSGYPFHKEHWIKYAEKWSSQDLGQHLTTLVVGDTNYNGLPDIVVGSREGGIFIFENNGTIVDIHGQPFPYTQDNSYHLIYSDTTSIWRPIYSMDIGNLDGQSGDEVVIAAFSFNAYVLRHNNARGYYLQKLIKGFEPWTLKDFYPADEFIDNGSAGQNVYFHDPNYSGTTVSEPISSHSTYFVRGNYPYNTGAAQNNLTCYTSFVPNSTHSAWEVYDFGADEEGTGNSNSDPDIVISITKNMYDQITLSDFNISISPDAEHWANVPQEYLSTAITGYYGTFTGNITIDIDPILVQNHWEYFRYMNITVLSDNSLPVGHYYGVYYAKLLNVFMTVNTALSTEVGTMVTSDSSTTHVVAMIGTVDGRLLAFKYDSTSDNFELNWDSWVDDRFNIGKNIWDIEQVNTEGSMPVLYGVTDEDGTILYTTFTNQPKTQIPNGAIVDYTLANVDKDSEGKGDFIFSTTTGDLFFFDNSLSYDSSMTSSLFTDLNSEYSSNISVSAAELYSNHYSVELLIGSVSSTAYKAYDDFYNDPPISLASKIDIWLQHDSGSLSSYYYHYELQDLEITGQLRELLKINTFLPSASGVDIDDDGDIDLIISLDKLYLLWNVGSTTTPSFRLDSHYFDDINNVAKRRRFWRPQPVKFDIDDDYDLVLSYSNRVGGTYFENYGTATEPKWTEKKELMNNLDEKATINTYNLTMPLWVSYYDYNLLMSLQIQQSLGEDLSNRYYICMFLDESKNMTVDYFYIKYNLQTSFMVATDPAVSRIEVNSFKYKTSTFGFYYRNFGFRAIESWNNLNDLRQWTMTLDTADLDQDGKGEIIVGDYDSNVYIFEHMTNNTYKRAFRSPDMKQFVPTSSTPYASDQFGGFTGEFNQTIWNHVSYLLVNFDSDQDGKLEFAALAGTVLYVFEATGIDDTYSLMYRLDVLRGAQGSFLEEQGTDPSGLAWAEDLDLDGYGEFIIAFKSQIFVFELYTGEFYELFGTVADGDPNYGHYNLPGNSIVSPYLTITGLKVFDFDNNGSEELIIYGYTSLPSEHYSNGFVVMIESAGLGYRIVWDAPTSLTTRNKIYTVEIMDQDYDGKKELVVGGEKGVSIWEFTGSFGTITFEQVGIITGHMNYPNMPSTSILDDQQREDDELKQRQQDLIQIYNTSSNRYEYVACWIGKNGSGSQYAFFYASSPDGNSWSSPPHQITTSQIPPYSSNMYYPSMFQTTNRLYAMWVQQISASGSSVTYGIFLRYSTDSGVTWSDIKIIAYDTASVAKVGKPIRNPVMYNHESTGYDDIGIVYLLKNVNYTVVKYFWYDASADSSSTIKSLDFTEPFNINGIDFAKHPTENIYGLVMSANKSTEEGKDDYDIWFVELNSSLLPIYEPRQLLNTPSIEHTPSIAFMKTGNHAALVTFDAAGLKDSITNTYGMVSDDYIHWSEPDILGSYPSYFSPPTEDSPTPRMKYWNSNDVVKAYGFRGPQVTATYDGSFAVLTKFDVDVYIPSKGDYDYCDDLLFQVYSTNYTSFTVLNQATDIGFGDSDRDGLNELLIADGYYARLFELTSTANGLQYYSSKWSSEKQENHVSDVSIYDTNGNGFPELIFSVKGDDIYVYESTDLTLPISDIKNFTQVSSVTPSSGSYSTHCSADLNNDGITDIVVAYSDGKILGILGNNLSIRWTFTDSANNAPVYIADSIYQNNSAIITLYSNGTMMWLNKVTGAVLHKVNIAIGSNTLRYIATMVEATGDTTMDPIISLSNGTNFIVEGVEGQPIAHYTDSDTIRDLGIARFANGTTIILGIFEHAEWNGFSYTFTARIRAFNMSFSELWNNKLDYASWFTPAYPKLVITDINNDGDSEILASSYKLELYLINGTELWGTERGSRSISKVLTYDINHDGTLDYIAANANERQIVAYDGITGNATWYSIGDLDIGDIALRNGLLYFAPSSTSDIKGIGVINPVDGSFFGYKLLGDKAKGSLLVTTKVNGESAVIVITSANEILTLQLTSMTTTTILHNILDELTQEEFLSVPSEHDIAAHTIITDDFYGDGNYELFYVFNSNQSVLYDPLSNSEIFSIPLDISGNVVYALPARVNEEKYNDSIIIVTDTCNFGYLDVANANFTYVGNLASDSTLIEAIIGYVDEDILVISYENGGNYYINAFEFNGAKLWTSPINLGSFYPDKIISAHFLYGTTGHSQMLVIQDKSAFIKAYYLDDGTYYVGIEDGTTEYMTFGEIDKSTEFMVLYYQKGEMFYCYSINDKGSLWSWVLPSSNPILSITIAYDPNSALPDVANVYVSQAGVGLYKLNAQASHLIWRMDTLSFATNYLSVVNDDDLGNVLLAVDYHRVFAINLTSAKVISATTSQLSRVDWFTTAYYSAKGIHAYLLFNGHSFYYRGMISTSSSQQASVDNQDNIVSVGRLLKLAVPVSVIFISSVATMVIITKRTKNFKN